MARTEFWLLIAVVSFSLLHQGCSWRSVGCSLVLGHGRWILGQSSNIYRGEVMFSVFLSICPQRVGPVTWFTGKSMKEGSPKPLPRPRRNRHEECLPSNPHLFTIITEKPTQVSSNLPLPARPNLFSMCTDLVVLIFFSKLWFYSFSQIKYGPEQTVHFLTWKSALLYVNAALVKRVIDNTTRSE